VGHWFETNEGENDLVIVAANSTTGQEVTGYQATTSFDEYVHGLDSFEDRLYFTGFRFEFNDNYSIK